jgi:gliding motility-associated-like protein
VLKVVSSSILILISTLSISQNLIFNPNFEIQVSCPQTYNSLNSASGWRNPTDATPDYFSSCSPNPSVSVPANLVGFQLARSDSSYSGFIAYDTTEWREYIQGFMPVPLAKGKIYFFQMFLSLGNESIFATSDLGVFFSKANISTNTFNNFNLTPQIINKNGLLTDTLNWMEFNGYYTASGDETYIVIGNFNNNTNSNYQIINPSSARHFSYYYIDDVSLTLSPYQVDLGNDIVLCSGQSITLDATVPNATYLWSDSSQLNSLKIDTAGTYWVEVTFDNFTTRDEIKVSYINTPIFCLGTDTTICEGDSIEFDFSELNATYEWNDNNTNAFKTIKDSGLYSLKIENSICSFTDSIYVQTQFCNAELLLPNVFTPNNDGINDVFKPIVSKRIIALRCTIYNRLGRVVYLTEDLDFKWQGTDNSDGIYLWRIDYLDEQNKQSSISGNVSLLR